MLLQVNQETITLLANGFILTSIVWASALAMAIDRRLFAAALRGRASLSPARVRFWGRWPWALPGEASGSWT